MSGFLLNSTIAHTQTWLMLILIMMRAIQVMNKQMCCCAQIGVLANHFKVVCNLDKVGRAQAPMTMQ